MHQAQIFGLYLGIVVQAALIVRRSFDAKKFLWCFALALVLLEVSFLPFFAKGGKGMSAVPLAVSLCVFLGTYVWFFRNAALPRVSTVAVMAFTTFFVAAQPVSVESVDVVAGLLGTLCIALLAVWALGLHYVTRLIAYAWFILALGLSSWHMLPVLSPDLSFWGAVVLGTVVFYALLYCVSAAFFVSRFSRTFMAHRNEPTLLDAVERDIEAAYPASFPFRAWHVLFLAIEAGVLILNRMGEFVRQEWIWAALAMFIFALLVPHYAPPAEPEPVVALPEEASEISL